MEGPNICFLDWPTPDIFQSPASVLVQGRTCIVVPFDNSEVLKARFGSAKRQTSSTGKQFEGSHDL